MAKREENLIPFNQRSPEERRALAKAGAAASAEAKRKKKAMREQLELLLALPSKNKKELKRLQDMGVDPENIDNQMVLLTAMYTKACTGDFYAAQFIRDTVGEKPTDKHAVEVDTGLLDDIMQQLDGGDGNEDPTVT